MEMHQVRYFIAVADELNFSRAAEKCNVSQPSLSRAIQLLEGEFGGQLFRREHSRTHLSELGKMVRPYLETVYTAAVKAKQLSRDVGKLKRIPFKLGIMAMLIIVLTSGARLSSAADPTAATTVQQLSSTSSPTKPHKSCPFGSHTRSVGTCSSAGFVGLAELAADRVLLAEPNESRFVMTSSPVLAKTYGSRLERPPRF